MNKTDGVVCITAYVNNEERKQLLKECITSCKRLGMDVLVVSHSILSEEIIRMVDYYVYDADNRFSNGKGIILWKSVSNKRINIFSNHTHEYPIVRLMRNMLHTAKANGYKFFYAVDFDCIISDKDINKLLDLRLTAKNNNKDFIFFHPENATWELDGEQVRGVFYDLYVYGGNIDDFLKVFDGYFPYTLEEFDETLSFVAKGKPQCLEYYFYDAFKTRKLSTLIINSYVKDYLNTSEINKSVLDKPPKITILPGDDGKHYLYLGNDNVIDYKFVVNINGECSEHIINGRQIEYSYYLKELTEDCTIKVELYQGHDTTKTYNLEFKKDWHDKYTTNGLVNIY